MPTSSTTGMHIAGSTPPQAVCRDSLLMGTPIACGQTHTTHHTPHSRTNSHNQQVSGGHVVAQGQAHTYTHPTGCMPDMRWASTGAVWLEVSLGAVVCRYV